MEILTVKNLSFSYPEAEKPALENISFSVREGEFVVLCGESGCGKTTLLRLIKRELAPVGSMSGDILFCGKPHGELDTRSLASDIGYVMQNPESQIVTDKVWHELAFGMESLGCPSEKIRLRAGEMAGYFGIDESDIMILIDLGYDAMEIEELMYDPVMLREIVGECREMMACELRG